MFLLDTSALSELIRRRPNERLVARLRQHPSDALFTAAICVTELRYGALLRPDHETFWRKVNEEILSRVHVLSFGEPEALVAGEWLAHLRRLGRPIGLEDALIGATAQTHRFILVTRNVRHFERLPGLKVEDWFAV